jgi:PAT family beta-lactamase induction signal transducer AmpG
MAMYVLLSLTPGEPPVLYATVTVEAFAQGLADAAFLTFLSGLCAREFAATQYALLSSVPNLAIHTIGAISGKMAALLGWTQFYAVCMAGALPGMALMLILLRRQRRDLTGFQKPEGWTLGSATRRRTGLVACAMRRLISLCRLSGAHQPGDWT